MKKKRKHIFGKICLLFVSLMFIGALSLVVGFVCTAMDAHLDESVLTSASEGVNIEIFYAGGEKMDTSSYFSSFEKVDINSLNDYTKNAFIATEDKRFYSHHGVDVKRMVGALLNNIKKGKISEGASTISQQLIKNTHLSREKTLKRKVKEIKLAMELEKKYSKDEILQMYLSSIYFGNGCYGLSKASSFYFNKSPSELSLGESAMLASVINAPSLYDPINKNQNAEKRKTLVLKNMLSLGYITEEEFQKNANSPEKIVKTASKQPFGSIKPILSEVSRVLKKSESSLKNSSLKVYTSLDIKKENDILSSLKTCLGESEFPYNAASIVVDNNTKKVVAISSNSKLNLLKTYRQPGSTIKPIIVYAPALESGQIYPESVVVDEPININGYSPKNAGGGYMGPVSIRVAIEKSLNVPAVKTLSNLSVRRGKEFAKNLGIEFDSQDNNLALALGGMTKGVTIKQLADAYSTFASSGEFQESSLIDKIVDEKGKTIYESHEEKSRAMTSETAYIVCDLLKSVAKTGTAKRLSSLSMPICAKTGTVGQKGSTNNTDAFCVAYNKNYTLVSWIGASEEVLPSSINGSNYPTEIAKGFFSKNRSQDDFVAPAGVEVRDIDTRGLKDNKVELATDFTPARFKKQGLFISSHLPDFSTRASAEPQKLMVCMEEGQKPTLEFFSEQDCTYTLFRENLKTNEKIQLTELIGNGNKLSFTDNGAVTGELYEYTLVSSSVFNPEKTTIGDDSVVRLMSF